MNNRFFVSVIFATYQRADLLTQALDSLVAQIVDGFDWEIIAVDNCPQHSSKNVIESYRERLPIHYLCAPQPGKNSAINLGLENAVGDLLVFTDDDIIADPDWLQSFVSAAHRYPETFIFGGRILPKFPANYQSLDRAIDFNSEFVKGAYGEADWAQPEGPIGAQRIWGANMMIRKVVFENDLRFNPQVGPNGDTYVMGSETEFLLRAYAAGYQGIYVPAALVHHQIRKEQISMAWLAGRAWRYGRGRVQTPHLPARKLIAGVPRYLYKKFIIRKLQVWCNFFYDKKHHFRHVIELNKVAGEISQYRLLEKENYRQAKRK